MIDILYVFISSFLKVFNLPVFVDTFKTPSGEFPVVSVSFGSLAIFSIIVTIIFSLLFRTVRSEAHSSKSKNSKSKGSKS